MLEHGDISYFHGLYYFEGPTNFSRTADPCSICVTDVKRLFLKKIITFKKRHQFFIAVKLYYLNSVPTTSVTKLLLSLCMQL